MFSVGDIVQSSICPTMAGTITRLKDNRAVIKISRTRDYKSIGKEIVIDTGFWHKISG